MKKLLCLLLIAGCSNVEHHRHQDVVESLSLPQSAAQSVDAIDAFGTFDAFYFSDIFLNALDSSGDASGIDIDVEQQTQKLRNEYSWKSETNVFENSFTCNYRHKSGGESNGGKVTCEYLGNWHGQNMVARHYWTGGSGHFSDIVFYSVVDGKKHGKKLHVHRTILLGDRAVDGMLSHPIFDSKGKIYFYMHLSNATLLKAARLDEKIFSGNDGFTCCACYEIVGKCVYDIEKEKMEILSMIAFSDENQNSNSIPSQNSKIKSLLQSKMHSGSAIFNEKETKEFLKKLRKICSMWNDGKRMMS